MKNEPINIHITARSSNAKTGPIPVTTSGAQTCPSACPFNNANEGGCYANGGPLKMHWNKVTSGERGGSIADLCEQIEQLADGQLWRHNQAGDLMGDGENIDAAALVRLTAANGNSAGFTYTHYDVLENTGNRDAVAMANHFGFTVNLSANNLRHADELSELGVGPVAVVLPVDVTSNTVTPAGRRVVVCPATQRDDIQCSDCRLCAKGGNRPIIGFPAHGASKRKACAVAEG